MRAFRALLHIPLVAALAFAPARAVADPDVSLHADEGARPGRNAWAWRGVLDANTTTLPVTVSNAGGNYTDDPACFSWNTNIAINVGSQGPVTACWSLTSSVTIGSQSTQYAVLLTDTTGTTGIQPGRCVTIPANGTWITAPRRASLMRSGTAGYRAGICSGPVIVADTIIDQPRVPLCRVTNDCTEAGVSGGTCSTTDTSANRDIKAQQGCAMLVLKALSASTQVTVWVEQ